MTTKARKRLWYWRLVHCWSIIRLRRRIVIGFVLLEVVVVMTATMMLTPIFAGHATIQDAGVDEHGNFTIPSPNDLDRPGVY